MEAVAESLAQRRFCEGKKELVNLFASFYLLDYCFPVLAIFLWLKYFELECLMKLVDAWKAVQNTSYKMPSLDFMLEYYLGPETLNYWVGAFLAAGALIYLVIVFFVHVCIGRNRPVFRSVKLVSFAAIFVDLVFVKVHPPLAEGFYHGFFPFWREWGYFEGLGGAYILADFYLAFVVVGFAFFLGSIKDLFVREDSGYKDFNGDKWENLKLGFQELFIGLSIFSFCLYIILAVAREYGDLKILAELGLLASIGEYFIVARLLTGEKIYNLFWTKAASFGLKVFVEVIGIWAIAYCLAFFVYF